MEKILSDITYDSMTGLRDRMTFFQDVSRREGRTHIVMIQLTRLMQANRKYGVQAGDQLIREISQWLEGLDGNYTAYRIANSRLLLMGPDCTQQWAGETAELIRKRFEAPWRVVCGGRPHAIRAGACLVHLFLEPEDTENDLLDELNFSLSMMQRRSGDSVLFFDNGLRQDMEHRKYVLEEVRYAIERQTFQMYYQPIYSCGERAFTSAESLIRLSDRNGHFISPGEFIPMAEDNGLIDQISWIVLEKVCRFLGEHPGLPLRTVSVNLTGQQILDPAFTDRVEELLEKYHVDGERLRIEITERTVTEDFQEVKRVMEHLGERGVRFYLDDFGTGFSNLSSMLSLPFEAVKFDQSLIRIMNSTDQGGRTIGLLAELMHENRYMIVAEGIETKAQAKTAQEKELDQIQGFFYAKPLSEDALAAFLEGS